MILPASIAEPPPKAMITSGSKLERILAPSRAHCSVGSGATSQNAACSMPSSSSFCSIGLM